MYIPILHILNPLPMNSIKSRDENGYTLKSLAVIEIALLLSSMPGVLPACEGKERSLPMHCTTYVMEECGKSSCMQTTIHF